MSDNYVVLDALGRERDEATFDISDMEFTLQELHCDDDYIKQVIASFWRYRGEGLDDSSAWSNAIIMNEGWSSFTPPASPPESEVRG